MSRVLFGQSYFLRFDPKLWQAMRPYPPLGTLYAASYLRERGFDVALFDAMLARSEQEWAAALAREQPRYAVLFDDNFNYLSKMCLLRMREAAFTMIDMARAAGATIIVCSADAADHAARYLARGAHYVIRGEGEAALGELLAALDGRASYEPGAIAGLVFRDPETGALIDTGPRPPLRDLDALPFPAWDLVDVARYRRAWARHGVFSMNLVSTRGCPYHCNWCAKPIWGQTYATRSPANVVAEMAFLRERYRPDHVAFVDDIFGLRPGWLPEFAERVQEAGAVTPFRCLSRADLLLREGEVAALRRAGCAEVWMGAESGAQAILDAMEKGTRIEQIREAAARLRAAGIRVGFFLQFGYPGEGWPEIQATFELVRDCRPDDIGMSVSYPLPGTPFHARVAAELGERQNWADSADLAMLYRGPYSTSFYRTLHRVLHKEFRLRNRRPATPRQAAARAYQAVTLPVDRLLLAGRERIERGRSR